jgi:hypothetical protein
MANTPAEAPPRYSAALRPEDVEASEQELVELLQKALAPAFVLIRRLGAGGMGIVYLARDPALKRLVAVKVMSPDRAADPHARLRFQREAEAVAAISHPNVVSVYSVGALPNGVPYLVMQYVEGPSMAERLLREGPLDLVTAKQVMGQVASALEAAHRKGIIHRDIKAANILWDDLAGRALVTDFGIAAVLEQDFDGESLRLTQTGAVMGTPRYMSPEQLLSEPVTARSDIYSLGLLGYELLTCEGPYQVTSPNAIVAAHLRDAPRPIALARPDVDPVFESLLAGMLEKDAHARPTAEDIARRLNASGSGMLEWPPPGLEDLQGAASRPINRLLAGALLTGLPLALVTIAPVESGLRPGWPSVMLVPLVAGMGAVLSVSAAIDAARAVRLAFRAARAGYGWGIIAEVLADADRDTGAVIAGDREFAALTAEQRNRVRRWRVLRMGLTGGAALWLVAGFMLGLPIAVRFGGSSFLAAWALGIPAAMLLAASMLRRSENRVLDSIRTRLRRHRTPIDRLSHLAQTWRDAFERVIPPGGRGQGAFGKIARRAAAVSAAAIIGAAGLSTAVGLLVVSVGGEVINASYANDFSSIQEKIRRGRKLEYLRPALDKSITPAAAGMAVHSLTTAGRPGKMRLMSAPAKPIAVPIEIPDGDPFFGKFLKGHAIRKARAGLTPAERAYLVRVASLPGAAEFSVLAHAPFADWLGVAVINPLPESTVWAELPLPRYAALKNEGYANVARAALALADGRADEAERLLRENVGVGFALMDGTIAIENLIGLVIAGTGATELQAFYEVMGRPEAARAITTALEITESAERPLPPWQMPPREREQMVMRTIRDNTAPRGVRWEAAVASLAYESCNDLGQVLFGPNETHRQRLAEARKILVRTPGEDRLMQVAERALNSVVDPARVGMPVSIGMRALHRFAQAVDALTGSRRMQACVSVRPIM